MVSSPIITNRLSEEKVKISNNEDIIFQAIGWHAEDVDMADYDGEDSSYKDFHRYMIKCFGVDKLGRSVSVTIKDFQPYFYVKLEDTWTDREVKLLKEHLKQILPKPCQDALVSVTICEKKDFWGFTNFRPFKFACIVFKNQKAMKNIQYRFQSLMEIRGLGNYKFKLYESNIDPFIRFIHTNDLEPTGWIKIPANTYRKNTEILSSTSQIDVETHWPNLKKYESLVSAPFVIASFDIECMSRSGDFPVPVKDYKKLAMQLYDVYSSGIKKEWCKYKKIQIVENCLLYALGCEDKMKRNGEEAKNEVDHFLYDKFINKVEFKKDVSKKKLTMVEIVRTKIDDLVSLLEGRNNALYKIKARDPDFDKQMHLHIISELTKELNGLGFPEVRGDEVIQIGTTVHVYGERQCCYKHILTLNKTDDIENVCVDSCENEKELLLKWKDFINLLNPDVMTGYNIFGFDFTYIYERACDLGIKDEFMNLSRFKCRPCEFKENKLSSSALGDNILRFIDMHGRVLIDMMKVVQRDHKLDSYKLDNVAQHFMGLKKNDVSPQEIFKLQDGSPSDRKKIAEYCIQDCELCNNLVIKLEIVANNMGMSNVCLVPLSFIFMRGQGIKIFSLVLKQCRDNGYLIPVVKKQNAVDIDFMDEEDSSYEGAIVLDPKEGIYIDDPVSVMDYSSLYPSSMISENLSHDCMVIDPKYDNLDGVSYLDISYDKYAGKGDKKEKVGVDTSRFVQLPNGEKGIIPRILQKLLVARKTTRKRIENKCVTLKDGSVYKGPMTDLKVSNPDEILSVEDEYSDFQKAVLDGLQNAYKVTANSLYGQMGASTSQLYLKEIAACTTATGRNMILKAKEFLEKNYAADIVYGDTDSVFAIFPNKDENGNKLKGHAAIMKSIETATQASKEFKALLKKPHDLEYEKTFWPFILLSKKRYVGNLYEMDDKKWKQKSMGIVLKRRDNAPIVKTIYGGIIDIILNKQNVGESIEYLKNCLTQLVKGQYPLDELVITKSLRANYKNPLSIAHKVLADRMTERDPGDKPQVNDRIPYAYIQVPNSKKVLQGYRIEHPNFIRKNDLKIDYNFYLTNQIMNSVNQVYGIIAEQIPGNKNGKKYYDELWVKINNEGRYKDDPKKAKIKWTVEREQDVQRILFDPFIEEQNSIQSKNHKIMDFFSKAKPKSAEEILADRKKDGVNMKKDTEKEKEKEKETVPLVKENKENKEKEKKKIVKKPRAPKNDVSLEEFMNSVERRQGANDEQNSSAVLRQKALTLRAEKKSYKKITDELGITLYRLKKILDEE